MRVTSSTPATPLGLGGVIVTEVTVAVQNTLKLSYFTSSLLCVYLIFDSHYSFCDMYLNLTVSYRGNLEIMERISLFSFKPHPPRHFRA